MYVNKSTQSHKRGKARAMQSNRWGIQVCILGLIVEILISCQSPLQTPTPTLDASLMDRSLLTDKPCSAPCWYGLELGKSTKAEVLATLQTLSFADPKTISESASSYWDYTANANMAATVIGIDCRWPNPSFLGCAGFTIYHDTLVEIFLSPNYTLTLKEIVDHLGPPDYVGAPVLMDLTTCQLMFMWVKKQILIKQSKPIGKTLCEAVRAGQRLDPNLILDEIEYMLPPWLALAPEEGRDHPWPGFAEP